MPPTHHNTFGNFQPGNAAACGNVENVTLSNYGQFGINVSWALSHAVTQDTSFGVYLNGRLMQIQPGNITSTTIIAPSGDVQEVEVIAWPSNVAMPDSYYLSAGTRRAHLEWTASAAADLAAYNIYHGTSPAPTTLYATQSTVGVNGTSFDFPSGASCIIGGAPSDSKYHNCEFTLAIDTASTAQVWNSVDAEVEFITYVPGQPFNAFNGLSIVIAEPPLLSDVLNFNVGILSYYDTAPLSVGTHYFNITSVDRHGNESAATSDIALTITPPPAPVAAWDVEYGIVSDDITYSVTQSTDGATVNIYSNYDPSTNTLLAEVNYATPLTTLTLAAGLTATGDLLTNMSTRPSGTYVFTARAVSAGGVESDDTTNESVTLPYTDGYPILSSLTVTQEGGDTIIAWVSDRPWESWFVSWTDTPIDGGTALIDYAPDRTDGAYYYYSVTITSLSEGEHTITVNPAGVPGASISTVFTFDNTAPAAPTNPTGIAY